MISFVLLLCLAMAALVAAMFTFDPPWPKWRVGLMRFIPVRLVLGLAIGIGGMMPLLSTTLP